MSPIVSQTKSTKKETNITKDALGIMFTILTASSFSQIIPLAKKHNDTIDKKIESAFITLVANNTYHIQKNLNFNILTVIKGIIVPPKPTKTCKMLFLNIVSQAT